MRQQLRDALKMFIPSNQRELLLQRKRGNPEIAKKIGKPIGVEATLPFMPAR